MKAFGYFGLGVVVGSCIGMIGSNLYFKKVYSEQATKDVKDVIKRFNEKAERWAFDVGETPDFEETEIKEGSTDQSEAVDIIESCKYYQSAQEPVSYNTIAHNGNDPVNYEHPTDDDAELDESVAGVYVGKADDICVIEDTDVGEAYGSGGEVLYYYDGDKVVTDENDEVVEDSWRIVGDCMERFHTSDISCLYINSKGTVYEVSRVRSSYYDSH